MFAKKFVKNTKFSKNEITNAIIITKTNTKQFYLFCAKSYIRKTISKATDLCYGTVLLLLYQDVDYIIMAINKII